MGQSFTPNNQYSRRSLFCISPSEIFLVPCRGADGNSPVADALALDSWHDATASGPDKETLAACLHLFLPPCRLEL